MNKVIKSPQNVYKQISADERDVIACLLAAGYTQKEIARLIRRHPSTISREIRRNGSPVFETQYRANRAQLRSDTRKHTSHQKVRLKNPLIREYVIEKLQDDFTPEQIAGRIGSDKPGLSTNYESIYLFIYNCRPDLAQYLVWGNRKRQKRSIKPGKRVVKIPNRTMIGERPKKINERREYGHWEADTVISRKSKYALVVVRERKMQLMFIRKIPRKNVKYMNKAVVEILKRIPAKYRKSITFDNGLENAGHEIIASRLNLRTYFCNAYHSWEKGGIENSIGLVRRFYPKKTDFSLISHQEISLIERKLNNRPRKTLGFKTPLEVYKNCA